MFSALEYSSMDYRHQLGTNGSPRLAAAHEKKSTSHNLKEINYPFGWLGL